MTEWMNAPSNEWDSTRNSNISLNPQNDALSKASIVLLQSHFSLSLSLIVYFSLSQSLPRSLSLSLSFPLQLGLLLYLYRMKRLSAKVVCRALTHSLCRNALMRILAHYPALTPNSQCNYLLGILHTTNTKHSQTTDKHLTYMKRVFPLWIFSQTTTCQCWKQSQCSLPHETIRNSPKDNNERTWY